MTSSPTTSWAPSLPETGAAGTSEEAWPPVLDRLPSWSAPAIGPAPVALVVAPHPDDETLGVGGTIMLLLSEGWSVVVAAVTDGEAAFGRCCPAARRELAARRRQEQDRAVAVLGRDAPAERLRVVRFGLPDGAVTHHRAELATLLRPLSAAAHLCLAPLLWDGHPDHDACGAAALHACGAAAALDDGAAATVAGPAFVQYPIWAWHWSSPSHFPVQRAAAVRLSSMARARKAAAIRCHASQLLDRTGAGSVVPPPVLRHFARAYEVLVS